MFRRYIATIYDLAIVAALIVMTPLLLLSPAFAQDAVEAVADGATQNFTALIVTGVLAALPSLLVAIWAWFKAHAAETEATWDDEAVAFVEKIAQRIAEGKTTPLGTTKMTSVK